MDPMVVTLKHLQSFIQDMHKHVQWTEVSSIHQKFVTRIKCLWN